MNDQHKTTSNIVIPAKAGIQKVLKSLDSRLRGSDKLIIIRGSHRVHFFMKSFKYSP